MPLFFLTAFLVVLLDRFTKQLAFDHLRVREESIALLADWLKLTYTENTGIAFGISLGSQQLLVAVTALILVVLFLYVVFSKNRQPLFLFTFGLIMGGGVGNLVDRAIFGKVVDFLHVDIYQGYLFGSWVSLWPVFNIADSAITIGVCILLLFYHRIFEPQN